MVDSAFRPFLPQIANKLEALMRSVVAGSPDSHAAGRQDWVDTVESAAERAISNLPDLIALARICRFVRTGSIDTPAWLRDVLDVKLQTAVIDLQDHGPEADAGLLALHGCFMALEHRGRTLSRLFSDDDDAGDAARTTLIQQQKSIVCQSRTLNPTTLAGYQAIARMLLVWNQDIGPSNHDGDRVEDQLLWLLVRGLLGAEQATALAGTDPDALPQATGAESHQRGRAANTDIEGSSGNVVRIR